MSSRDRSPKLERPAPAMPSGIPKSARAELSGARKTAILILALDDDVASQLLRSLSDDELEDVTRAIDSLGFVDSGCFRSVLEEFRELFARSTPGEQWPGEAGADSAQGAAHGLGLAEEMSPLGFLAGLDLERLHAALAGEHPQTVAVTLTHIDPVRAAEVLARMGPERGRDVIRRIAALGTADEEVLRELESGLRQQLRGAQENGTGRRPSDEQPSGAGLETAASILRASGGRGRRLLHELRDEEPDLATEIRRRLLTFEDLDKLGDSALGALALATDHRVSALALRTAPRPFRERWLGLLPDARRALVKALLDDGVPVRLAEIERAREEIVEAALKIEEPPDPPEPRPKRRRRRR